MFAKQRRLILLLLISSATLLCIICRKDGFWCNSRKSENIFYSTNKTALDRNGFNNGPSFVDSVADLTFMGESSSSEGSTIVSSESPDDLESRSIIRNRKTPDFLQLKSFLLFIGYPRSGSTLIGSLLDAHPNMVIANEYNLLGKWKNSAKLRGDRMHIFRELWENSVMESLGKQRAASKRYFFSYFVPGMWQGNYRDYVKIIGDKRCTSTTRSLASNNTRFAQLKATLKLPIRFIHIIRNPFDIVATMTLRSGAPGLRMKAEEKLLMVNAPDILQRQSQVYLNLVDMNARLHEKYSKYIFDVDYSSFVRQPREWWKRICDFLEIYCSQHYIDSVEKVVFKKETYTRRRVQWTPEVKQRIMQKINSISFLKGMKFDIS